MANATNVTKYAAGGSGDNVISDGYIKTVEKVWLDSYVFTASIPSGTTVNIAAIPKNKKITSIDLYFVNPSGVATALSSGATLTGTTISIGYRSIASSTTAETTFLNAGEAIAGVYGLSAIQGFQTIPSVDSYVYLTFGRIATTATAGTILTRVRYT